MTRPFLLASLVALAACEVPTAPERSNPADPGWPTDIVDAAPPGDLRLAAETPDPVPLRWDAPGADQPLVVGRLSARVAGELPSDWSRPLVVGRLAAGRTAFTDTTLVAPAAACYRVALLDLRPFLPASNTLCVETPVERRSLVALGRAISTPLVLALDGETVFVVGPSVFAWNVAADAGRATYSGATAVAGRTTAGGAVLAGGSPGAVRVWSVTPTAVVSEATLAPAESCAPAAAALVASRDGSVVAAACGSRAAAWSVATGEVRRVVTSGGFVDVSPDGRRLLFTDGQIRVVSVDSGETLWTATVSGLTRARFVGDQVLAYGNGLLGSYDAATGDRVASRPAPSVGSPIIASRDGRRAIVQAISPYNPGFPAYAVVDARTLDVVRLVREPFSFETAVLDGERVVGVERGGPDPARVEWMDVRAPWRVLPTPDGLD